MNLSGISNRFQIFDHYPGTEDALTFIFFIKLFLFICYQIMSHDCYIDGMNNKSEEEV